MTAGYSAEQSRMIHSLEAKCRRLAVAKDEAEVNLRAAEVYGRKFLDILGSRPVNKGE